MKPILTTLVASSLILASSSFVVADNHKKHEMKDGVTQLLKSDDIVGATLWNFTGDNLGSITQLLLSPSGSQVLAVVNTDILDDDKDILIPFSKIYVKREKDDADDIIYTLDTTKAMLQGAPVYKGEEDLKNMTMCDSVCKYWKVDDKHVTKKDKAYKTQ